MLSFDPRSTSNEVVGRELLPAFQQHPTSESLEQGRQLPFVQAGYQACGCNSLYPEIRQLTAQMWEDPANAKVCHFETGLGTS